MSMLPQSYNIIICRGISAPGHGKELVDGLNNTGKSFIFHFIEIFYLTGSKYYYNQMDMHSNIQNAGVILAQ